MGYSTEIISKEQAVKETSLAKTTGATKENLLNGGWSLSQVDYVEKSDHTKPRYRFIFKNGFDWVVLEKL